MLYGNTAYGCVLPGDDEYSGGFALADTQANAKCCFCMLSFFQIDGGKEIDCTSAK